MKNAKVVFITGVSSGMRRTPGWQASILSKLRRYLPAGPVDASLRKQFGMV